MEQIVVHDGGQAMQQTGFDYSMVDEALAAEIHQIADAVRCSNESMAQHYIDNGKRLLVAFEKIPHIYWRDWLLSEFNWTEKTAQKMMRIARYYGELNLEGSRVTINALMQLSRKDIPAATRAEATSLIESGLLVDTADATNFLLMHDSSAGERLKQSVSISGGRPESAIELDLILSTADLGFAVRNMQVALANSYPVPFKPAVADALERLQDTADALIRRVRKNRKENR